MKLLFLKLLFTMLELWSPYTRAPNWAVHPVHVHCLFFPHAPPQSKVCASTFQGSNLPRNFGDFCHLLPQKLLMLLPCPVKLPQGSGIKFTPPRIVHCLFWVPFGALVHATSHMYKKMGILCHVSQGFSFWTLHFFSWSVRLAWQQQAVCVCAWFVIMIIYTLNNCF